MVPFFIFYSMFGFQRVGDLIWAAGDMQAKGFLMGATSGRTTLNGEGLQHQDGHSHLLSSTVPNCVSYDPTYGYELAVIIHDGLRRMYADNENLFYYITLLNENYEHPAMPEGVEEGIRKGMYLLQEAKAPKSKGKAKDEAPRVQLLGSGSILREVLAAAELLDQDFGVAADVWSVPSFTELRRDGIETERWNRLHPTEEPRTSYVEECLDGARDRSSRRPTTCAPTPSRSALSCRAVMSPWAPTAIGRSDTREPSCAASSRSTATTWQWRRSRPWPTKEHYPKPETVAEAIEKLRDRNRKGRQPWTV